MTKHSTRSGCTRRLATREQVVSLSKVESRDVCVERQCCIHLDEVLSNFDQQQRQRGLDTRRSGRRSKSFTQS